MRCFFYGTLMDPDLLAVVIGRAVPAGDREPAALAGYRRVRVRAASFPALVPAVSERVEGLAVGRLSAQELDRARFFEGEEYALESVRITLRGPEREVPARAFVRTAALQVLDAAWSFADWRASPTRRRDLALTRKWMALYGRYAPDDPALDAIWEELALAEGDDAADRPKG